MRKKILKGVTTFSFSLLLVANNLATYELNATDNIFDFSRENSLDTVVVEGEELFELITHQNNLTDLEKKHLNSTDYQLKYENKIPNSKVYTVLNNSDLIVHATDYNYQSSGKEEVCWIPYSATINDTTVLFEFNKIENEYICEFNNVLEEDEYVSIEYVTNLQIDNTKVNSFINYTYNLAKG